MSVHANGPATGTHHGIDWELHHGIFGGWGGMARVPVPHPINELWLADNPAKAIQDALGFRHTITFGLQPWLGFYTGSNDEHIGRQALLNLCDTIAAYGILTPNLPTCTSPQGGEGA